MHAQQLLGFKLQKYDSLSLPSSIVLLLSFGEQLITPLLIVEDECVIPGFQVWQVVEGLILEVLLVLTLR